MLGVTKTPVTSAVAEELALHCRWRSLDMPLRYNYNSQYYKIKTATKVPQEHIDIPNLQYLEGAVESVQIVHMYRLRESALPGGRYGEIQIVPVRRD
jgi:hypothetical protein